jgi:hypothetical protein
MLDDSVNKKKRINRNNTSPKENALELASMLLQILVIFHVLETFSSNLHHCCSLLEFCYKFWLYFMFLKLSTPSSIIVVAYLNVDVDFSSRISCS